MTIKSILVLLACITCGTLSAQELAVTMSGDTIYVYMDGRWTYEARTAEEMAEEEPEPEVVDWMIDTSFSQFFKSADADKRIKRPIDFYSLEYVDKYWKRLPPASVHPKASHAFQFDKDEVQVFLIVDTVDVGLEQAFKGAMKKLQENPETNLNVSLSELRTLNGIDMVFADYTIDAGETSFRFNTYFYSGPEGTIQYNAYCPVDVYESSELYIEEMLNGLSIEETKGTKKPTPRKNTPLLKTPPKKKKVDNPEAKKKKSKKALDSIFNN